VRWIKKKERKEMEKEKRAVEENQRLPSTVHVAT
jgi:hypothetical protein